MQVQAQALFNFVLNHPAEIATGMVAAAAVSTVVQKNPVFNGSKTLAVTNGFFAGAVVTAVTMQPGIGLKLCGAIATVAFAALAIRASIKPGAEGQKRTTARGKDLIKAKDAAAPIEGPTLDSREIPSAAAAASRSTISPYIRKGHLHLLIERIRKDLSVEGLFRENGSVPSVNRLYGKLKPNEELPVRFRSHAYAKAGISLNNARPSAEENDQVIRSMLVREEDVKTITSLMKRVIKECYPSLLEGVKIDLISLFSQVESEDSSEQSIELTSGQSTKSSDIIASLAPEKKEPLKAIIGLLKEIADREATNRMSPENLATCMAPNLFSPPETSLHAVYQTDYLNKAITSMIKNYDLLF